MQSTQNWKLSHGDSFRLEDPAGSLVRLPTRKAEMLLSLLAAAGGKGEDKTSLQRRLWPELSSSKAAANLRQTVMRLRRALGPDAIISDAVSCRLGSVRLNAEISPEAIFNAGERKTPALAFLQMVRWGMAQDPVRAVELLRSNHDITLELTPTELRPIVHDLLTAFPAPSIFRGWSVYFLGMTQFQSAGYSAVIRTFAESGQFGAAYGDRELEIYSCEFLAAAAIAAGRPQGATRAQERLIALARTTVRPDQEIKADAAQGTALLYQGRISEGMAKLEKTLHSAHLQQHDRLQVLCGKGLAYAQLGRFDEAHAALAEPRQVQRSSDFKRLDFIVRLAEQAIIAQSGDFDELISQTASLIEEIRATDSQHFEIAARESLAIGAHRAGARDLSEQELRKARQMRHRLEMRPTWIDRHRLAKVPEA